MADQPTKASKVRVLVDSRINVEWRAPLLGWYTPGPRGLSHAEWHAEGMEDRVKELNALLHGHRGYEGVSLAVERIYEDRCSICTMKWQTDSEGLLTVCAYCRRDVQKPG